MVEISPALIVIIMFGGLLVGVFLGYPLGYSVGGIALFVGFAAMGPPVFSIIYLRVLQFLSNFILLAIPLFVFMGVMVERSGAAERLYGGLYLWLGGLRGGLAISTILMGTILAACVGVIAASVSMIGLIAVPSMLKRGYDKELVCGAVCAGGTLGILIPPSIMLVIYGPMAQISVGKLFMAAFVPGFVLSGLYITYIAIRCWLKPQLAPLIPVEERKMPQLRKIYILLTGMLPPAFLILAVLGSIFFGIATPTEAAAVGCVAAVILAIAYRRFNRQALNQTLLYTMKITCMIMLIGICAQMFTGVFLRLGGGEVVSDFLLAAPGGKWGIFALIMFVIFILGFVIDWIGILFIMIPIMTPIGATLGFDPLWFAMMVCINLQMAFMTPPIAAAIIYLRGIAEPDWGLTMSLIIRGIVPFVLLIMVGLGLCVAFPEIILWLPSMMIK